jgi:hypothetical protein
MNRVNAILHALNHVTRTSLGRLSPSWTGLAVLVASLATVGGGSVTIRAAHAAANEVPCTVDGPKGLLNAIAQASSGDVLSLAEGCVYTLTDPYSHAGVVFQNGLPRISHALTIKGNGATITRTSTPSAAKFRIFEVDQGGDLTLQNLTVANGDASGNSPQTGRGGGIYNLGTLKVINSTISNNNAAVGGGGIANGDAQETSNLNPAPGNLTLSDNSVVSGNSAGANGGGIANGFTSTMDLTRCTISGNSGGPGSGGGGIANQGTARLKGCRISNNTAPTGGGIISVGQVFLINSPVTGNSATDHGGGILNGAGGAVTLTDSPVTGNSATNDGGGIENFPGAIATLTSSAVNNNKATTGNSGGIGNAGSLTSISSIVSGNNAAKDGGGIGNAGSLTLISSIVFGNSAAKDGGGIFNQAGTVCLNGTVVTGNSPNDSTNVVFAPSCQ